VTRFRHAVDFMYGELEHDERSWADVAIACGLYDQAHLVNEFRELAGIPPTRLFDFGFFQDGAAAAR
jgi:AraC-like DNA-binding protein